MIIQSLEDYIRILDETKQQRGWIGGSQLLYRGHSDESFKLVPRITRRIEDRQQPLLSGVSDGLMRYEFELVQKARIKLPELISDADTTPIILAKLQHYGLPTRLLDFTENALVALYFACADDNIGNGSKNGEVIVLEIENVHLTDCFSPFVQLLADTSIFYMSNSMSVNQFMKDAIRKKYLPARSKVDNLKTWLKPYFFTSIELTERQKRQQGLFCIFPHKLWMPPGEELSLKVSGQVLREIDPLDETLTQLKRITIKSESKKDILNQLNRFGINKSFLFPESANVCAAIRNEFEANLL